MEWLKLWIPFIGTLVGIYVNYRISKKNSEESKEFQENQEAFQKKMTQKQIDANLKAKARIEWITEVRKMSANLISSLVDIKNMNTDYEEKLAEISKEAELLKLYFGSYKTDEIKCYDLKVLMNDESNDDKNPHMFLYIDNLLQIYGTKERKEVAQNKKIYNRLHEENKTIINKLDKISQYTVEVIEEEGDEDEEVEVYTAEIAKEGHEEEYFRLKREFLLGLSQKNLYRSKLDEYYNRTEEFEKIISVYLKLEWDRAKNGE